MTFSLPPPVTPLVEEPIAAGGRQILAGLAEAKAEQNQTTSFHRRP
jgi:hypothetical protein